MMCTQRRNSWEAQANVAAIFFNFAPSAMHSTRKHTLPLESTSKLLWHQEGHSVPSDPCHLGGHQFPKEAYLSGSFWCSGHSCDGVSSVFFVMRFRAESARRSWVLACFLCTWNLLGTGSAQKRKGSRRIPESVFPLASAANQQRCRERRIDSTFASLHERQSASGLNP